MTNTDLYNLIKDYYGDKVTMRYLNSNPSEIGAVLYESFLFVCNIENDFFKLSIDTGIPNIRINKFLGRKCECVTEIEQKYEIKYGFIKRK